MSLREKVKTHLEWSQKWPIQTKLWNKSRIYTLMPAQSCPTSPKSKPRPGLTDSDVAVVSLSQTHSLFYLLQSFTEKMHRTTPWSARTLPGLWLRCPWTRRTWHQILWVQCARLQANYLFTTSLTVCVSVNSHGWRAPTSDSRVSAAKQHC